MIIFYVIPALIVIFALYYIIQNAVENSQEMEERSFTSGQKTWLIVDVLVIFASIASTIIGFINSNAAFGTVGILVWMTASIIAAYVCSPLRLISQNHQVQSGEGCAYMIYLPILCVVTTTSCAVIMLASWVFALYAVFKR